MPGLNLGGDGKKPAFSLGLDLSKAQKINEEHMAKVSDKK